MKKARHLLQQLLVKVCLETTKRFDPDEDTLDTGDNASTGCFRELLSSYVIPGNLGTDIVHD